MRAIRREEVFHIPRLFQTVAGLVSIGHDEACGWRPDVLTPGGEVFERPPWLGAEVTGQPRYDNSALAQHPYATWQRTAGLVGAG